MKDITVVIFTCKPICYIMTQGRTLTLKLNHWRLTSNSIWLQGGDGKTQIEKKISCKGSQVRFWKYAHNFALVEVLLGSIRNTTHYQRL